MILVGKIGRDYGAILDVTVCRRQFKFSGAAPLVAASTNLWIDLTWCLGWLKAVPSLSL